MPPTPGLTYLRFLACYLASYSAGLLASLPGGIGVFDTAMLLGLSSPTVLGRPRGPGRDLLLFRLYYYIIPLFLAGTLFAGHELLLRGRSPCSRAPRRRKRPPAARWGRISELGFRRSPPPPAWWPCAARMLLSLSA